MMHSSEDIHLSSVLGKIVLVGKVIQFIVIVLEIRTVSPGEVVISLLGFYSMNRRSIKESVVVIDMNFSWVWLPCNGMKGKKI